METKDSLIFALLYERLSTNSVLVHKSFNVVGHGPSIVLDLRSGWYIL